MENLDFTKPRIVLCIGGPGKGKTNAVKWMLMKNTIDENNKIFQAGIVFTRLKYDYDYLPEEHIHTGGYDQSVLEEYLSVMEKYRDEHGEPMSNFIVFDDLIGLLNKQDPYLINVMATHRHFGTSIFLNSQHLNTGASTTLREITNYAVLFNSRGLNTLKSLYENFGQLFDTFDEFKQHFLECTNKQYHAMLYIFDKDIEDNYLCFKPPDMSKSNYKIQY